MAQKRKNLTVEDGNRREGYLAALEHALEELNGNRSKTNQFGKLEDCGVKLTKYAMAKKPKFDLGAAVREIARDAVPVSQSTKSFLVRSISL